MIVSTDLSYEKLAMSNCAFMFLEDSFKGYTQNSSKNNFMRC